MVKEVVVGTEVGCSGGGEAIKSVCTRRRSGGRGCKVWEIKSELAESVHMLETGVLGKKLLVVVIMLLLTLFDLICIVFQR